MKKVNPKQYLPPELEMILFDTVDVIITSRPGNNPGNGLEDDPNEDDDW